MTSLSEEDFINPIGRPAPVIRFLGWASLTVLAAFMVNNILITWFNHPTLASGLSSGDSRVWVQVGLYAVAIAASIWWIFSRPDNALRYEASKISNFNAYLIRGCFFAVLFVGLADMAIAFLRVEGFLGRFFSESTASGLLRAQFIGPYVHVPLVVLGFIVALFSRTLGFQWLALLIVAAELLIVFSRFVFSYEQALMGDLVRYWYAALFLFASAYTLLEEGHVRVDVLYAGLRQTTKGRVNAFGTILLGMTTCWCIILIGMGSQQAIINSPIKNFEVSQAGTAGMYIKYQMAAFLAVFAITMLIQFVSYLFEAVADARNEPGHKDHAGAASA
ncbi:TRAP transporter small permease subunit [Aestuariivita boseongensis]|uniref:TRAP transporter small permease subunit n=1 Tax=Aestuariivita boseongensis TaxID=1470562 RepID=UPI0006820839|nr:TRAP transporter small permease subunit [Aestuariivita boseongensis]